MIEHVPKMEDIRRVETMSAQYPEYKSLHERMVDESRMEDIVKTWAGISKRPDISMYSDVPHFATETGPCAPDSVMDTMRYRAMRD